MHISRNGKVKHLFLYSVCEYIHKLLLWTSAVKVELLLVWRDHWFGFYIHKSFVQSCRSTEGSGTWGQLGTFRLTAIDRKQKNPICVTGAWGTLRDFYCSQHSSGALFAVCPTFRSHDQCFHTACMFHTCKVYVLYVLQHWFMTLYSILGTQPGG